MATMNISLPEQMKDWVEQQVATGRYANASDYVRDVLRRDQEREADLSLLRKEIDRGLASGISTRTPDELREWIRQRAEVAASNGVEANSISRSRS